MALAGGVLLVLAVVTAAVAGVAAAASFRDMMQVSEFTPPETATHTVVDPMAVGLYVLAGLALLVAGLVLHARAQPR